MEREGRSHTRGGVGYNNSSSRGEPDFLLQWGNRKRLRCVKIQVKDDGTEKTTVRVDRRVVRADKESSLLLPRPAPHRILRNSETSAALKIHQQMNGSGRVSSPERGVKDGNGVSVSTEGGQDKKGGGSSSGSDASLWPKFAIGLTNREKEEDFFAFKGSKLPLRPKKRAKFVQKTLNLVSPGTWLCDLSQERYEVREKVSKKRPRGLKAMGGMESDSE